MQIYEYILFAVILYRLWETIYCEIRSEILAGGVPSMERADLTGSIFGTRGGSLYLEMRRLRLSGEQTLN